MWKRISNFRGKINCINKENDIQTEIKWASEISRNYTLQIESLFLLHYNQRNVLWAQWLVIGLRKLGERIWKYLLESRRGEHTPITLPITEMLNEIYNHRKP